MAINLQGLGGLFQDPTFQMGAQMMAAGGPTRMPVNFGGRMMNAMNAYDIQLQRQLQRKMLEKQTDAIEKRLKEMDADMKLRERREKIREQAADMLEKSIPTPHMGDYMEGEEQPPSGVFDAGEPVDWRKMAALGIGAGDPTIATLGLGGMASGSPTVTKVPGYGAMITTPDLYGNQQYQSYMPYHAPGMFDGFGGQQTTQPEEEPKPTGPGIGDRVLNWLGGLVPERRPSTYPEGLTPPAGDYSRPQPREIYNLAPKPMGNTAPPRTIGENVKGKVQSFIDKENELMQRDRPGFWQRMQDKALNTKARTTIASRNIEELKKIYAADAGRLEPDVRQQIEYLLNIGGTQR